MPRSITPKQACHIIGSPYTPLRLRWKLICLSDTAFGEMLSAIGCLGLWAAFVWEASYLAPISALSSMLQVKHPDMWALVSLCVGGMQLSGLIFWKHWVRVLGLVLALLLVTVVTVGCFETSGITPEFVVGLSFFLIGGATLWRM